MSDVRASARAVRSARRGPGSVTAGLDVQRLLLAVFLLAVLVKAALPLVDPDLWWHLANGRLILASHTVPSIDVYSFTATGRSWVVHEWLSDTLMYAAFGLVGFAGLAALSAAVITATQYLVYRLLRSAGLGVNTAVLLAGILALASSPSWGPRPQVINQLFAAATCLALLRYRDRPGAWVYWFIPAFVAWANLHSGYIFGAGLVLLFAAGETLDLLTGGESRPRSPRYRRRLLVVGLAALAAGLATPATYRTILFPFGTLGSSTIQENIVEWATPDFRSLTGFLLAVAVGVLVAGRFGLWGREGRTRRWPALVSGPAVTAVLVLLRPDFHRPWERLVLVAVVSALLVLAMTRQPQMRLGAAEVLWAAATLVLAMTSLRHVALFASAAAPALGASLAWSLDAAGVPPRGRVIPSSAMLRLNWFILGLLGLLGVAYVAPRLTPSAIAREVARVEPVGAVDHMLAAHSPQPLYNFYDYGGYVIWRAVPPYRVFIDGRVEVYGDGLFRRYLQVNYGTPQWRQTLADFKIRTVLLPSTHPLRPYLLRDGWQPSYSDGTATVYSRDTAVQP
jgi:hypothetical protein